MHGPAGARLRQRSEDCAHQSQSDIAITFIRMPTVGFDIVCEFAPKDILIVGGGITRPSVRFLMSFARKENIFERGGELVRVTQSGEVFQVNAEWLSVYLTEIVRFIQVNKGGHFLSIVRWIRHDGFWRCVEEWNLPHRLMRL